MKSLDELKALREKAKQALEARDQQHKYRLVVGMATCGIAAGAKPIFEALKLAAPNYPCTVVQTGCIGMCTLEPIVEVYDEHNEKVTYVKMDPEKALKVLESHIKNGEIVEEYTVNAVNKEA
jgi:NADP-reducing hydrogenase subunit HndB